jgi:hypothetical protein
MLFSGRRKRLDNEDKSVEEPLLPDDTDSAKVEAVTIKRRRTKIKVRKHYAISSCIPLGMNLTKVTAWLLLLLL